MAPTFEAEPADLKAFLAAKDVELVIACLQEIFERDVRHSDELKQFGYAVIVSLYGAGRHHLPPVPLAECLE